MSETTCRTSRTLSPADAEQEVVVQGWAQDVRNLGGISFLQLRDRYGIVQITAPKKKVAPEVMEVIASLSRESVVRVTGMAKASGQAKGGVESSPPGSRCCAPPPLPCPWGSSTR